jgi:hypothetical protein
VAAERSETTAIRLPEGRGGGRGNPPLSQGTLRVVAPKIHDVKLGTSNILFAPETILQPHDRDRGGAGFVGLPVKIAAEGRGHFCPELHRCSSFSRSAWGTAPPPLHDSVLKDQQMTVVKTKKHRQVPVKVNAWVEEGVAPLVEALNRYDQVWTTSSSAGEGDRDRAHVVFAYNGRTARFCNVAQKLANALSRDLPNSDLWNLQVQWAFGSSQPLATLEVKKKAVAKVSRALRGQAHSKCPAKRTRGASHTRGRAPGS